jgi:hypothetical protein
MANEITLNWSFQARKGNLNVVRQGQFYANMNGTPRGGSPGNVNASIHGTDVPLSQLVSPAMILFTNLDTVNFVTVGVFDTTTSTAYPHGHFLPLFEIQPGESYPMRVSRELTEDIGSGTGSVAGVTKLRLKADTAPVNVDVECFEA